MNQLVTGTVQGRTILLNSPLPVPDGHSVEVLVRTGATGRTPGDGIIRSAGALALEFTDDDKRILAEIYQARHMDNRREIAP